MHERRRDLARMKDTEQYVVAVMLSLHRRVGSGSLLGRLEPTLLYSIVSGLSLGEWQGHVVFSREGPAPAHLTRSRTRPA